MVEPKRNEKLAANQINGKVRSENAAEKVLCLNRGDIPEEWLQPQSAVKVDEEYFFSSFSRSEFLWLDRDIAERSAQFKQIIPYIIVQSESGQYTAVYRRGGSESRLHDLWSIGVGGHINPQDDESDGWKFQIDCCIDSAEYENGTADVYSSRSEEFRKVVYSGMLRELDEEMTIWPSSSVSPDFIGTINDDLSDVGKVHFGAVFRIAGESRADFQPGDELVDFQWVETALLYTEERHNGMKLELWANLSLKLL